MIDYYSISVYIIMARTPLEKEIDVIGIGAINYDYIAKVSKSLAEESIPESGDEDLTRFTAEELANPILKYYHSKGFIDTQIGGSSYLAIKTISYLQDLNLNTAYVGAYSTPGELERKVDFFTNVSDADQRAREEFSHLADDEWLFEIDGTPGRGLLELSSGKRQKARVGPGTNTELVAQILEKEKDIETDSNNEPLTEYLASAQWVHLTSFADFDQFNFFVNRIKEAKRLNPHLRVSIDPGYEYTYRHTSYDSTGSPQTDGQRVSLDDAFEIADYAFMNTSELTNLSDSDSFEIKRDADTLTSLSVTEELQAVIVKEENRHLLINLIDNVPYYQDFDDMVITEYWHRKLGRFDIKNDTGTGDALAGGVIAGILSPTTLSYEPVPVEVGSSLASEVLQSYDFPAKNMNNVARNVITKKQKQANPTDGFEKKINTIRANHGERIEGLLIGIAASALVYLITVLI